MSTRPSLLFPPWWARRCPFCSQFDGDGVTEPQLWEHLAVMHEAAAEVAAVFADIDSGWFDELARRPR